MDRPGIKAFIKSFPDTEEQHAITEHTANCTNQKSCHGCYITCTRRDRNKPGPTAPLTNPSESGFPCIQLTRSQAIAPAANAVLVVTNALAARPLAPIALPALNPNQPNQRSAAPRIVRGMLWGSIAYLPKPNTFSDHQREGECSKPGTDMNNGPPAKSSAPNWAAQPPPQTQWASGS